MSITLTRFARMSRAESCKRLQLDRIPPCRSLGCFASSEFHRAKLQFGPTPAQGDRQSGRLRAHPVLRTRPISCAIRRPHPLYGTRRSIPRASVAMINIDERAPRGKVRKLRTAAHQHDNRLLQGFPCTTCLVSRRPAPATTAFNFVTCRGTTTRRAGRRKAFCICRRGGGQRTSATMSTDAKIDLMLRFGSVNFTIRLTEHCHTLTESAPRRRHIAARGVSGNGRACSSAVSGYPFCWAKAIERAWGCALHEGLRQYVKAPGSSPRLVERGRSATMAKGRVHAPSSWEI